MIDVLVEASAPNLYAEIADLIRDHSQIRLIESGLDTTEGSEGQPQPDVVLVATDADRPGPESFDWNAGGWNAAGVPVILLVENPAHRILEALATGVRAVLPRNATPAEIVGAIEAVAAGLYAFHPSDVDSIPMLRPREADTVAEVVEPLLERLTPREIEVLQLLSGGLGNKEIASRLNISEHTAKFHVASIMGKLGATSRTEAVTLGIRHGLVMI
ncbi:MAG: DNA-binding response regulator [Acidobacteria bacterium]|nr:MAG: DNA-binding response regulator [Acidobacteriota bacterium]